MHVFIVYAHPSEDSFTYHAKQQFVKGLIDNGHTYEISDLYKMGFNPLMNEYEYLRESNYRHDLPLQSDVVAEQEKINKCDAIVFIYPVFWTEAPSILVGWFNRVWTYGFAYGEREMETLKKALVICTAGRSVRHLREYGHLQSMEKIMLGDRILDRAEQRQMIVLDEMTKYDLKTRNAKWEKHLERVKRAAEEL